MNVIISGTNRVDNATLKVSNNVLQLAEANLGESHLIDLLKLDGFTLDQNMYEDPNKNMLITNWQDEMLIKSDRWIVVVPEYNGSFPGIFKLFLDILSTRKYKETFLNKKIFLVGVSTGRAGNLRGMDHLTNIFSHLGSNVFHAKCFLSNLNGLMDGDSFNSETADYVTQLLNDFKSF